MVDSIIVNFQNDYKTPLKVTGISYLSKLGDKVITVRGFKL